VLIKNKHPTTKHDHLPQEKEQQRKKQTKQQEQPTILLTIGTRRRGGKKEKKKLLCFLLIDWVVVGSLVGSLLLTQRILLFNKANNQTNK